MSSKINLSVVRGDVADVDADLLLLKYARRFYGADETIAFRLIQNGRIEEAKIDPGINEAVSVDSQGVIAANKVMFLGTPSLIKFRYPEMREYAKTAIERIGVEHPDVTSLACTVHGAGYGLDIEESLHALIFGFQVALSKGAAPNLESIQFVERNSRRFDIISRAVNGITHLSQLTTDNEGTKVAARKMRARSSDVANQQKKQSTDSEANGTKKLVFVAMPFSQDFEDVYQFGIYEVVRRCGFVCERVDDSYYAGNMVDRIKEGISNAEFVIADLSAERPNVYLEVGYAWGLGKPVLLIARDGQTLHFDLAQHKCIFYPTIVKLADELERTIRNLFGD